MGERFAQATVLVADAVLGEAQLPRLGESTGWRDVVEELARSMRTAQ